MKTLNSSIVKLKTDIGFKRMINRENPVSGGYERKFVKCKKCSHRYYYDFVPYSLSSPIIVPSCGHDFKINFKEF